MRLADGRSAAKTPPKRGLPFSRHRLSPRERGRIGEPYGRPVVIQRRWTTTGRVSVASSSSHKVVYAALAGNIAIAVSKFAAAMLTGSSAMLSEAIHSTVDTGNELLLMLGMSRARKPADASHPFGHGLQLYFWVFVVAVLIFGFGAVFSFIEGLRKIADPTPIENPIVNYAVLGLAI